MSRHGGLHSDSLPACEHVLIALLIDGNDIGPALLELNGTAYFEPYYRGEMVPLINRFGTAVYSNLSIVRSMRMRRLIYFKGVLSTIMKNSEGSIAL